jgi:ABC-type polysaccharide/polyol phosphate export permease
MSDGVLNGSLLRSIQIQRKVIGALFLREIMTRYGRHNIGFLWLFVEPMLFTLGVTALWTFGGLHHGSKLPITAFALTGYSAVLLWRNMPARCVNAIAPNSGLLYHRNVRIMDVFISRVLLEAVGATISFVLLSIIFVSIGWMHPPEDPITIIAGWLLLAWFGSALAILLGALSEISELVEKLWHPAAYLLFPLSGAAYLVDATPKLFQEVVLWLPMVHGTEMIRDGYFGSAIHARYDVTYLALVSALLTLFGLAIERKVTREYIPE